MNLFNIFRKKKKTTKQIEPTQFEVEPDQSYRRKNYNITDLEPHEWPEVGKPDNRTILQRMIDSNNEMIRIIESQDRFNRNGK